MTETTLDTVIELTKAFRRERGASEGELTYDGETAICQEALIFGIDVEDYAWRLESVFGAIVREIPWLSYTDQTSSYRGCGAFLVPFILLVRLPGRLFFGRPLLPSPNPRNFGPRLTLRHIAQVIDDGHWAEP